MPLCTLAVILRSLRLLSVTALLFIIVVAPSAAQQGDLDAILKRFNELNAAGNYPAALVEAQKLEAAVKARFGISHPGYGAALSTLAMVYNNQGKYADAEGLFKRALAIFEKARGTSQDVVAETLYNLAVVYSKQGKDADAEGLYKRALAIYENTRGISRSNVVDTLQGLGLVYKEQGKYADAEGLYKRALAIREKTLGTDHPDAARTLHNLAQISQLSLDDKYQLRYLKMQPRVGSCHGEGLVGCRSRKASRSSTPAAADSQA